MALLAMSTGPTTFFVSRYPITFEACDGSDDTCKFLRNPRLTLSDVDALQRLPTIRTAGGRLDTQRSIAYKDRRLRGVDVVVNAVGILRERRTASFAAIHEQGPAALFEACIRAGVPKVVQISALGAEPDAPTGYFRSKAAGDTLLSKLPLEWVIVQPSLVFGASDRQIIDDRIFRYKSSFRTPSEQPSCLHRCGPAASSFGCRGAYGLPSPRHTAASPTPS